MVGFGQATRCDTSTGPGAAGALVASGEEGADWGSDRDGADVAGDDEDDDASSLDISVVSSGMLATTSPTSTVMVTMIMRVRSVDGCVSGCSLVGSVLIAYLL